MNIQPRRLSFAAALAPLLLLLALLPGLAPAGVTNISTVPLLNIDGTGSVKPNLMLLFDNSGSMDQAYTPDYIEDSRCRRFAVPTVRNGLVGCVVGHPPYMSSDYNRQYYNPKIRYSAPIKADGTYYPNMTSAQTSAWTRVTTDGFDAQYRNLLGTRGVTSTNLVSGFPDLKWCNGDSTSDCKTNTATYRYPDDTYSTSADISTGPYYYDILAAEFCTDDTMVTCVQGAVGAPAPAGYPVAAKLRWCNSTALTDCKAKRVGSYTYPRYSNAVGANLFAKSFYGTIAIGASATAGSVAITNVTIADPSTARTIINGTVTASTGTNSAAKQQAFATLLAKSIIDKTGLANQYWACVDTPSPSSGSGVAACSSYGITLGATNLVAVIPIVCSGTKSAANCTVLLDNSRAGWGINVIAPSSVVVPAVVGIPPTGLIRVSGTSSAASRLVSSSVLASVSYKGSTLATSIAIGTGTGFASAAAKIVAAINGNSNNKTVRAYDGGNSVTSTCADKPPTSTLSYICLVETAGTANGGSVAVGSQTNQGTMSYAIGAGAGYVAAAAAVNDAIPVVATALSGSTFVRTDIVPGRTSYPKALTRTDCAASNCTYAEEMTNFANWYAYYKTRLQMMKSAIGQAFAPLTANYRVGYVRLSVAGAGATIDLTPGEFTGSLRTSWYQKLYATTTDGSTPSRAALHNVGNMFANKSPYEYSGDARVVQFPCQQNFTILTTDGYWNGSSASGVSNNDTAENSARFCLQAEGCPDPRSQTSPSLADVALYWYNGGSNDSTVSLRSDLEPDMSKDGLVRGGANENTHLHMNTFTLGLGMDGIMNYEKDYDTNAKVGGDFYNVVSRTATGCTWNGGGAYVWPNPDTTNTGNTVQERVDDLWHAAVNGHGKYFSAADPSEVVDGLGEAITKLQVKIGAAAAAATSTPNISQEDRDIFSATFTTVKWYGELSDRYIDPVTGVVESEIRWSTTQQLGQQVASATDSRSIRMLNTATGAFKNFSYDDMTATEKAWFANKCGVMTQCTLMSAANKVVANNGVNLVNWLRGQQQYANDTVYRSYSYPTAVVGSTAAAVPIVLGDIASAKPAYLYSARKSYTISGYDAFKVASLTRRRTVFAAANDGMLHAFYAPNASVDTPVTGKEGGKEIWAYVPRITMGKLAVQASTGYGTNHQFTTDGSPEIGDVQITTNGTTSWRTVLVAGLNSGGRGFYALDVTDPENPAPLWELCADSALCSQSDADIGLSFGNPQIGKWNNKWVVLLSSGYNNVPGVGGGAAGDGKGYLYIVDIATGAVLKKVGTASGSQATPSGLAKLTAISLNPSADPNITYVYGGDTLGQMWRFDLTDSTGATVPVVKMGDAGSGQPITTRPEVTTCLVTTSQAQRVVVFGTGRLLDVPDVTDTTVQTLYAVKDSGSTVASLSGDSMVQQTLSRIGVSSQYTVTNAAVDLSQKNGWYVNWSVNAGERLNLDPTVLNGSINAVTNIPSSDSTCTVGGSSNAYQLNVCTGGSMANAVRNSDGQAIVGNTVSNASAVVGSVYITMSDGSVKRVDTLADGSQLTSSVLSDNDTGAHKTGWRRVRD